MNVNDYKGEVAEMGCLLCEKMGRGGTPAELHHPRIDQGMSERGSDWTVIPLCPQCHRGPHGIHGDRQSFRLAKTTEMDLLAEVNRRIYTRRGR